MPAIKFESCSDWIELGRPNREKNLVKALTMVFDLIFPKGIASGNLVDAHMIVSRYWFPDFVFGSGLTHSTIIWLKGSLVAGIGCSGAFGMYGLIWFPYYLTSVT